LLVKVRLPSRVWMTSETSLFEGETARNESGFHISLLRRDCDLHIEQIGQRELCKLFLFILGLEHGWHGYETDQERAHYGGQPMKFFCPRSMPPPKRV
jgi:hypothetical protein